jgi:hypothetical protein
MPDVPATPLPEAQTEALPTPYDTRTRSPEEFGAALAHGGEQLATGLEQYQLHADTVAVQEAQTTYNEHVLNKVHGAVDPRTGQFVPGYRQKVGHDAIDATGDVLQDLEAKRTEIAGTLSNGRQQKLFMQRTRRDMIGAQRTVLDHEGQQINFVADQAFKTSIQVAGQTALAAYADPVERQRQIDDMVPWLKIEAERRGLKGTDAGAFVSKWQGAVVEDVLNQILADEQRPDRAADARAYYEQNKGLLPPDKAGHFLKAVQAAGVSDIARTEADRIWDEANGDPAKLAAAARGIKNTTVFDAVDRRLKQRVAEDHAMRVAADSPHEARLETTIYQSGGLDRNANDYQALSDEGKARVEAKYRASLRADSSEQRQADQEAYWTFKGMPLGNQQGQDRVSVDVDHDPRFSAVSPSMRSRIKYEQAQSQAEWAKDNGVGREAFKAKARQVADEMGWRGSEGLGAATPRARFMRQIETAYDSWTQANPGAKTVPPDEAAKLVSNAVRYGEVPGIVFSSNKYAWQASQAGEAAKFQPKTEAPETAKGTAAVRRAFGVTQPTPTPTQRSEAPTPVQSQADYDALPSGALYVGPDGQTRRKR